MFFQDYVINSQGHGPIGVQLGEVRYDPGMMRPYIVEVRDKWGGGYYDQRVTINTGRKVFNQRTQKEEPEFKEFSTALLKRYNLHHATWNAETLRKDTWIELDRVVLKAARARLRAWADLAGANTYGGFNGMAKGTLEYEAMSDPGEAQVDMDGLVQGRTDSPIFGLRSMPLPITHSDFYFSARRLAMSRNGGMPFDSTMAEAAGRRVAESIEKVTIGVDTSIQFGPTPTTDARYDNISKIYGYTNLPQRITYSGNAPTGSNASAIIADVIAMRELMYEHNFFGPFMLYTTPSWDQYLDEDYILTGGNVATQTLRERIEAIDGIDGVRRLDFWAPSGRNNPVLPYTNTPGGAYQKVLVQMTQDTARAINGMDITTVQWEESGGMKNCFKVLCIQVPQLRYDYNQVAALVHSVD
jgi:hypothetical protein